MRTANYTDLRANLKGYIDAVEYIMSSPETMAAIRQGEEDIKNGKGISQNEGESIDDFLNRVSCTK